MSYDLSVLEDYYGGGYDIDPRYGGWSSARSGNTAWLQQLMPLVTKGLLSGNGSGGSGPGIVTAQPQRPPIGGGSFYQASPPAPIIISGGGRGGSPGIGSPGIGSSAGGGGKKGGGGSGLSSMSSLGSIFGGGGGSGTPATGFGDFLGGQSTYGGMNMGQWGAWGGVGMDALGMNSGKEDTGVGEAVKYGTAGSVFGPWGTVIGAIYGYGKGADWW